MFFSSVAFLSLNVGFGLGGVLSLCLFIVLCLLFIDLMRRLFSE